MAQVLNAQKTRRPPGVKVHRFLSKHARLNLVRVPSEEVTNHMGQIVRRKRGVSYQFEDVHGIGVCEVYEGQDLLPDGINAETGEVVEQDAVSWLRNHHFLNQTTTGGFHEEGREPDRLLPTEQEVLRAVAAASVANDADALQTIIATEQETHNRALLIQTAQGALADLQTLATPQNASTRRKPSQA